MRQHKQESSQTFDIDGSVEDFQRSPRKKNFAKTGIMHLRPLPSLSTPRNNYTVLVASLNNV